MWVDRFGRRCSGRSDRGLSDRDDRDADESREPTPREEAPPHDLPSVAGNGNRAGMLNEPAAGTQWERARGPM